MFDWFRTAPKQPSGQQTERPAAALLRREFAGHPSRGLTPARLAQILQQAEYGDLTDQAALFQDMEEKDGHLAAELAKRKLAVTQLDWGLTTPRDASARERKAAQRLEDLIRDRIDLNRLRHDLLDAIGHGYACVELAWQRGPDGLWWPETLSLRDPGWFQCPADDRTTLTLRDGSMDGAPLTPFGWIPHVHPARSGYLPRLGLHRVLAWPYLYKNYSVRDLAEFLEIYGLPIRLGKYPHGTDAAQRQALLDSLLSIGHHAAGIIPDSMQVEIVNTMASGSSDGFQTMIDWCEATQSKAILGGTLTSQTGANGNRSLGDVHNEVRLDIRNDDAARLDRSLSDYLIYPIAVLNGLTSADRAPRFTSDTQEPDDLALYADALPKLVAIGAQIPMSYLHGKLKIPEPEGDEQILATAKPESAMAPVAEPSSVTAPPAALAAALPPGPPRFTPEQQAVERLANAAIAANPPLIDQRLIQSAIRAARDPEDLADRLAAIASEVDPVAFRELLARSLWAADLMGYAHASG